MAAAGSRGIGRAFPPVVSVHIPVCTLYSRYQRSQEMDIHTYPVYTEYTPHSSGRSTQRPN